MRSLSPVVIFTYRRPDHLRRMLESLMGCDGFDKTPVIVYCDGAKNADEAEQVEATRQVAKNMLGERAEYHFNEKNLGLSCSVIAGVTEVVNTFGRAIVIEDDLELSPLFLTFMNKGLDRYHDDEKVYQISGYMFDMHKLKMEQTALFLPLTVSWGWATWQRAWDQFDPEASGWESLRKDKNLRRSFNLEGSYDYATMLEKQMSCQRNSWAIRWYWTVFKAKGLVLFPPVSQVKNTGFDGSGTHGYGLLRRFSKNNSAIAVADIELPESVCVDQKMYAAVKKALHRQNGGWPAFIIDRIRRLLKV